MAYTKRIAHHNTAATLLQYIMDDEKTEEGILVSGFNCSANLAEIEFRNNNKHWKVSGNRVAYHLMQAFHPDDPITPEQAHEIGIKLCQELYPDFQCVVATHIDKHHIHNHIAINSVNLKGRKLEDRLANQKEGLYGFTELSDQLCREYGCFVLPARKIKIRNNKNYYYEYRTQTWKETIKEDIDRAKNKSDNLEQFFEELIALGYDIKYGKHLALRAEGMKKFVRLYKMGKGYDEDSIKHYFSSEFNANIKNPEEIKLTVTNFNQVRLAKAKESREALIITRQAAQGKVYNQYQRTRYQEYRRFNQLKEELECLNQYNINSFTDLNYQIEELRAKIKTYNSELSEYRKENQTILDRANKAREYIKLEKIYKYASYYQSIDKDYKLPSEAQVFLRIRDELKINSTEEANWIIDAAREVRLNINKVQVELLKLQRELNKLDIIKEDKLIESELYIHNIKFGANRIDYKNSNDTHWCVNLPYTDKYILIPKAQTTFNNKNNFYTLFLIDDMNYKIYEKASDGKSSLKEYDEMTGSDLDAFVVMKKEEITKLYADKKMEDRENETLK